MSYVNKVNARPGVYDAVIGDIAQKNVCPFCPEHLAEFHKNPVERRGHWLITDNMYPYKPTKRHILLIHEAHIDTMTDLSPDAWKELKEIVDSITRDKNIAGGTFMLRFGETKYTGASVTHLHAHLVQSDPDDSTYDPSRGVLTRVG